MQQPWITIKQVIYKMGSDLEERNAKAVMNALRDQNAKLQEFHEKIIALSMQVNGLNAQILELKKKNMQDLVAQFSSGPTA